MGKTKVAIAIGLWGLLISLFIGLPWEGISQETKEKDDQKAYEKYVKLMEKDLEVIKRVSFALDSGASPKKIRENLKNLEDNSANYDEILGEIKRPLISIKLFQNSTGYYGELLGVLENTGSENRITKYFSKIAQGFITATETALKNEETITTKDCSLCHGKGMIECYWCGEKRGVCSNCKGKKCSACDKTGLCPVCLGEGEIPCRVCIILRGPMTMSMSQIPANEICAIAGLAMLFSTNATWNQQNPAGCSCKAYWTYDISCFNRMFRPDGKTKVNFVNLTFAKADGKQPFAAANVFGAGVSLEDWSNVSPKPKSGYWFQAMTDDGSGANSYLTVTVGGNNIAASNQYKFGFVAYPAEYGKTGVRTFIINEAGTVYAIDCGSDEKKIVIKWPGGDPTQVKGPGGKPWEVAD
jgi:hypothetical protein